MNAEQKSYMTFIFPQPILISKIQAVDYWKINAYKLQYFEFIQKAGDVL